jgi:hypothetical protein
LGIITSNSVACHSQLRGVCAKLIPPFDMQLWKVRPNAVSNVVTHESASQHHIVYQILRDVFGSRLIGPTQKHSSSTSKNMYSTFNTVRILYINRLWLSQKVHCLLFNVHSGLLDARWIRISIQSLELVLLGSNHGRTSIRSKPTATQPLPKTIAIIGRPSLGLVLAPVRLTNATEVPNSCETISDSSTSTTNDINTTHPPLT